jgi:hypothetical protein
MKAKIDRRKFIVDTAAGGVTLQTLQLVTVNAHAERGGQVSARAAAPAGFGSLADLHRAVDDTLATGRIGRPVFVRYSLYGLNPSRRLIDGVAALAATAIRWVGGQVEFITAIGSDTAGQLSSTLVFKSGESASLTSGRAAGPGSGVDLMILGSHGALYHDGGTSVLWSAGSADPGAGEPRLAEIIARSLLSGQAEPG